MEMRFYENPVQLVKPKIYGYRKKSFLFGDSEAGGAYRVWLVIRKDGKPRTVCREYDAVK